MDFLTVETLMANGSMSSDVFDEHKYCVRRVPFRVYHLRMRYLLSSPSYRDYYRVSGTLRLL